MKKRFNATEVNQKYGNEISTKFHRSIAEQSKRLDDARSYARNIGDLFTPNFKIQRRKLIEYCERLIFTNPSLYGPKGEEILWRKGFYDAVSTAKKLKNEKYTEEDIANLQNHIYGGIGFYHHLILKLQSTFNLNVSNLDFTMNEFNDDCPQKDSDVEFAKQSVYQCLIYLGDLSRYKLEVMPETEPTLALRYYLQAISYKPEQGMPYNQMGTLAMSRNNNLDAVYHYMRCLACKHPFEGTSNNLLSVFEKNSKYLEQLPPEDKDADCIVELSKDEKIKRFIARFLLLIDIWYFNKTVSKVYSLCHQTFKDLGECLSFGKIFTESVETPDLEKTSSVTYLNSDILFKISIICLMCLSKLQETHQAHVSTVQAFTIAVYSQLLQNIINHIQVSVMKYPLPEEDIGKNKKLKNKLKLRRRKLLNQHEESESSEDDLSSSESSDDSFLSEDEDVLVNSSDEEGDTLENGVDKIDNEKEPINNNKVAELPDDIKEKEEVIKKVKRMDVNHMLEIISEETSLNGIKILNDWLMINPSIIKSCSTNTRSLFRQITFFLNLVNLDVQDPKINGIKISVSDLEDFKRTPLPEDVVLKGWEFMSEAQKQLDWNVGDRNNLTVREETLMRIFKIKTFGDFVISLADTKISYDKEGEVYVCEKDDGAVNDSDIVGLEELEAQDVQQDRQQINGVKSKDDGTGQNKTNCQLSKMRHMGQLWLASEVSALEHRVSGKTSLSPYLVLDADALIKYTFMVRHLVNSRKFIIIVPSAVVSALDHLKHEKTEARDAIRWLETQFQRGNRFFRSQRPQERASIPFIKYPKKKDKEMFTYISIIECCYYLAEQQQEATNLVTLLIGNHNLLSNGENRELSYVGLAKSAGIAIESITHFYGKWKKSR